MVGSAANALRSREPHQSLLTGAGELGKVGITSLIVFGALLPDISLFIMFGYAQLTGVPNDVIWSEMYYSHFWQNLGAITNSVPIFLVASLVCWIFIQRSTQSATKGGLRKNSIKPRNHALVIAFAIGILSLSSLLHVAMDLPLHHDDGHPHFWPFTHWIFASPVSYCDAAHYANFWVPIECAVGLALVAIIWKSTKRLWAKGLLFIAGLSYPVFALFFFS